jgi:hypothetical protein
MALTLGEANDVASVVAGGDEVVGRRLVAIVTPSFIVGTTGETNVVPTAESPEPPATVRELASSGCARSSTTAAMIAPPPTIAASDVMCLTLTVIPPPGRTARGSFILQLTAAYFPCYVRLFRLSSGFRTVQADWKTIARFGNLMVCRKSESTIF